LIKDVGLGRHLKNTNQITSAYIPVMFIQFSKDMRL